MCDPLTLAAIGMTVGSTFLSSRAASQVDSARTSAMVTENTRQDDLQRQAIASLKGTQEQFTPEFQNEGIEAAAAERIERLQGAVVGSGETEAVVADLPFAGSAPDIVRETAAKRLSEGLAEGKGFAKRLGRFGAFGEQNFQNRLDMNRLGERMGMIGGESRNSAQLLPFELDAANRAGDTMSGFADILGSLGSVAGLGSAVGANPFGGFGALTGTSIIPDFLRGMPPIPGSKPILPIPFEGPLQF